MRSPPCPGIDVLWIGHFDLSISLGIPGQFDHPRMIARDGRSARRLPPARQVAGIMAADVAGGHELLEQGFRMLAYSGDLWIYQAALRQALGELRK